MGQPVIQIVRHRRRRPARTLPRIIRRRATERKRGATHRAQAWGNTAPPDLRGAARRDPTGRASPEFDGPTSQPPAVLGATTRAVIRMVRRIDACRRSGCRAKPGRACRTLEQRAALADGTTIAWKVLNFAKSSAAAQGRRPKQQSCPPSRPSASPAPPLVPPRVSACRDSSRSSPCWAHSARAPTTNW